MRTTAVSLSLTGSGPRVARPELGQEPLGLLGESLGFDVRIQSPGAGDETGDERAVCEIAIGRVDRIGAAGAPLPAD